MNYTKTEQRILAVLADGEPHLPRELVACIEDDLATSRTLHNHLVRIRRKLPEEETILCQLWRHTRWYRRVRLFRVV